MNQGPDETTGLSADAQSLYWRLKGHLAAEFTRYLDNTLEKSENRVVERIENAVSAQRRSEDLYSVLDQRLRVVESGLSVVGGQARLMAWAVPIGFTVLSVVITLIQLFRGMPAGL